MEQYNTSKVKMPITGNSTTHQKIKYQLQWTAQYIKRSNTNYREQNNSSKDQIPITGNSTTHQKIKYQLQGTEQHIKR